MRDNQKRRIRAAVAPVTASALLFAGAAFGVAQANHAALNQLNQPTQLKVPAEPIIYRPSSEPLAQTWGSKSGTSDLSLNIDLHSQGDHAICAARLREIDRLPAGCPLVSVLTVTNDGTTPATNVVLKAPQPKGWIAPLVTAPKTGCGLDENEDLSCDLGTIQPGDSKMVEVEGITEASSTAYVMSSVAQVTADGIEQSPEDNVATDILIVQPEADLTIFVSPHDEALTPGDEITLTATVINNGPSVAEGVRILQSLTDALSADFTDVSITTSDGTEASCKDMLQNANTARCRVDYLGVGARAMMVVKGRIASSQNAPGRVLTTYAGVSSKTPEIDVSNNTAEAEVTLNSSQAALNMGVDGPDTVAVGEKVTWTFTIENLGPSDSINTIFKLKVPDALQNVLVTSDHGACTTTQCDLGTLLSSPDPQMPGNTVEVAVTGTVTGLDPFTVYGVVTSDTLGFDAEQIDVENESAGHTPSADSGAPNLNRLPPASDQVTDDGAADRAAEQMDAGRPNLNRLPLVTDDGRVGRSDHTVADTGKVGTGHAYSTIDNGEDELSSEPQDAANEATQQVVIDKDAKIGGGAESLADMAVSNFRITPMTAYTGPGSQRRIEFDVTNNGPAPALYPYFRLGRSTEADANLSEMRVNNQIPQLDMSNLCQTTSRELMCSVSASNQLAAGETVHVSYVTTLASLGRPGKFPDYIHVYSQTTDPNQANDNTQADVIVGEPATHMTVSVEPDETVANWGSPGTPGSMANPDGHASFIAGGTFSYKVDLGVPAGNYADASEVNLIAKLPKGFKASSATTASGHCELKDDGNPDSGSSVNCNLPILSAGSNSILTISGTLSDNANDLYDGDSWAEQVPLTVTATTTTPDVNGKHISVSDTAHVDIIESADLQLYVSPDEAGTSDPGTVGYTLTVLNTGPSGVEHAAVTAVIPDGYTFLPEQSNCVAPANAETDIGGDGTVDLLPVADGWTPGTDSAIICKVGFFGTDGYRTGNLPAGEAGQVRVVFKKAAGVSLEQAADDITFVAGSLAVDPNHTNNRVVAPMVPPQDSGVLTPGTRVLNKVKPVLSKILDFVKP